MSYFEIIFIAVGLSADAFAVSLGKGLAIKKVKITDCLIVGLWFGFFQALMPLLGYYLGTTFSGYIEKYDHWIAFSLLVVIGLLMIKEGIFMKSDEDIKPSLGFGIMLTMSIATSIDAFATGISFSMFDNINIYLSIMIIGLITFLLSAIGVFIGNIFGSKHRKIAHIVGGIILIGIGIKILIEHLIQS